MNRQSKIVTALVAALCAIAWSAFGGITNGTANDRPIELAQAGRTAPNFVGIDKWLNSAPLSIADLRGKVVMVNFWTYGCYNCVNTLPHVTKLYNSYRDKDFVVVGIHTPEFPFEKSTANVQAAIKRHGIRYPVAQDNQFATWKAYNNRYWPAQYIVDQRGHIIYQHAGEGEYGTMERIVKELLKAES